MRPKRYPYCGKEKASTYIKVDTKLLSRLCEKSSLVEHLLVKNNTFADCIKKENISEHIKVLTKELIRYQEIVPDYSKDEKGFYLIQGVSLGIQMAISYLEEPSFKSS